MLLVKKSKSWYNIYNNKVGIGSTHPELQGYKLSQQNCDEIFGIVDVEKLFNEVDETIDFHEFCFSSFKLGVNKAMELNKDKQFTLGDVRNAMDWIMTQYFEFHEQPTTGRREHFLESLQKPTEIEVEIEMEEYGYCEGCRKAGMWHCALADTCGYAETRQQPKLDANGCIILKKILKK
jgi:hypothetical protein